MIKSLIQVLRYPKEFFKKTSGRYSEHLPYILVGVVALVVFVGGIHLFIGLTDSVRDDAVARYDQSISKFITSYRSPFLTDYFTFVTEVGDALGYLIVFVVCTIVFYLIFKNWKYVIQISAVLILALSSNLILKQMINRARPSVEHLVEVKTLSYPSGHAMMSMAFYGFLIYLIFHFRLSKTIKWVSALFLIVLILSIGISRIYLGVHYPTDIAGGFIAGFLWVVFCATIFNLIRIFKRDPKT